MNDAEVFWSAIGASATVAGVLAAFVSAGTVFFLRRRDRPEPDWIFARLGVPLTPSLAMHFHADRGGKEPDFLVMVTNAGDGQAFQLEASGIGADTEIFIRDAGDTRGWRVPLKLARVQPGEEFGILIWFQPVQSGQRVGVRLKWLNAPTRHGRYGHRELILANPEPQSRLRPLSRSWLRRVRNVRSPEAE